MRRGLLAAAVLATVVLSARPVRADVKPHALFSDGMVLQRGKNLLVWGTADPGEPIDVTLHVPGKPQAREFHFSRVRTLKDGRWEVPLLLSKQKLDGGPYTLTIKGKNTVTIKDVYIGEVWVCSGQSNMQWPVNRSADPDKVKAAAKYPQIRLFTVPHTPSDKPLQDVKAKWVECGPETVGNFSAVAYHFGRHLHEKLKVPVGLIHTSWGGTIAEAWTTPEALKKHPELKSIWDNYEKVPAKKRRGPNRPGVLYNGMIHPLQPYAIKGAIWYQGESNAGRAYQYRTLFPLMIKSWRDTWKQGEFPFLFVQLAPFKKIVDQPQESAWAELREAQLLTSQTVPKTAMAVITDVGNPKNVHPKRKEPVGRRLALAARAIAYGEKVVYSGPIFNKMEVEGDKAVLSFKHTGKGLEARGGPLKGFTVAGPDRKFHNAQAEVRGDKVVVWSDAVKKPAAVRYGWADCPVVNLWNKDGLPASPFRTDDFPGVTWPKEKKR